MFRIRIIEQYEELIERDATKISSLSRQLQVFCYFLCAISGYVSSILFHVFWVCVRLKYLPKEFTNSFSLTF